MAGCQWLGRDPERGIPVTQPALNGIDVVTANARRYGFHCTLKPPMRLTTGYAEFRADMLELARAIRPFELPKLAVADISGFVAICETKPSLQVQTLADLCVAWPDRHRAPPSAEELQRRRGNGLAEEADALLVRWGYPEVFSRWRFHMTLTQRLAAEVQAVWRRAAEQHFAEAIAHRRWVTSLCVFTQLAADTPFLLAERIPLH